MERGKSKFKVGDWVITISKSVGVRTYETFLRHYPLGVAEVHNIEFNERERKYTIQIFHRRKCIDFIFLEKDLILIDDK